MHQKSILRKSVFWLACFLFAAVVVGIYKEANAAVNLALGCPTYPDCGNSKRIFVVPVEGETYVSTPEGWKIFQENIGPSVLVCAQDIPVNTSTNDCQAKIQVEYCFVLGAMCIEDDPPEGPSPNNIAKLSWVMELKNTDGSELKDLAGFRIYSGTTKPDGSAPQPQDLGLISTVASKTARAHNIPGFGWGTYFFSISAYTTSGKESARTIITPESTKVFKDTSEPLSPSELKVEQE